jgi:hypothetical protein
VTRETKPRGPISSTFKEAVLCVRRCGEPHVFETLRFAEDFWIALEAGLPKMVADHHDWMRVAACVFAWRKPAAQTRPPQTPAASS